MTIVSDGMNPKSSLDSVQSLASKKSQHGGFSLILGRVGDIIFDVIWCCAH